jgi:hypothetical protein
VAKQYDPNALLYRWLFKEEDGLVRLVGTDPELGDRTRFFRWIDQPGGWEDREAWPQGATNVEVLDNALGKVSGWPGAVPVRKPVGRPRKDVAGPEDRSINVSASIKRAELFEVQRAASEARQSVPEWIAAAIRLRLGKMVDTETSA